jgi:hypothetical protein
MSGNEPPTSNDRSPGLAAAIRHAIVGVYRAETASELETTVDVVALFVLLFGVFAVATVAMLATGSVYVIVTSAIGPTGLTAAALLVAWFVAFVWVCAVGIRWLVVHAWRPINRARSRIDRGIGEHVGGIRSQPSVTTGEPAQGPLRELDARLALPRSTEPPDPTS